MFDTRFVFSPGKLTITLDGGAGSSGKGKLGSFLCEHADNWQFACNTFMPQAAHWVRLDDGRAYLYHSFNSCAYLANKYEKLYVAPGGCIELSKFWKEVDESNIPLEKIGISPLTAILQGNDGRFEKGLCDLDGNPTGRRDGGYLARTGTTAHGCGLNRARRAMRHPTALYARDVPELSRFLCDVPSEIMARLDKGQAGIFEIAQGFQLSYLLNDFFPNSTSRNCTVAAGLDDLMVPPLYAGNVVLNFRTYPIRINSIKYIDVNDGDHLTIDAIEARLGSRIDRLSDMTEQRFRELGIAVLVGDSGGGYPDQDETTWEKITTSSRAPSSLTELTSATRLPRRVFTFSKQNVGHAVRHNRTQSQMYLSMNFADYLDYSLQGHRAAIAPGGEMPSILDDWLNENLNEHRQYLRFVGTGPNTDDMIQIL